MLTGWLALVYGVLCCGVFFATFVYLVGFAGDALVPKTLDSVLPSSIGAMLLIEALLLSLFAVQHSARARPAFKRMWTRFVPGAIERSTYVMLASLASLALMLRFWQWRSAPGMVWRINNPTAANAVCALRWLGWAIILISSFLVSHVGLFGLRPVYLNWKLHSCRDYHLSCSTSRPIASATFVRVAFRGCLPRSIWAYAA